MARFTAPDPLSATIASVGGIGVPCVTIGPNLIANGYGHGGWALTAFGIVWIVAWIVWLLWRMSRGEGSPSVAPVGIGGPTINNPSGPVNITYNSFGPGSTQVVREGQKIEQNVPPAEPLPPPTSTSGRWLEGRIIMHRSLRLVDVPRDGVILRDRVFEDCTIYGPAMVALAGTDGGFEYCNFDAPIDAVLWELPESKTLLVGAIGLDRVFFRRCYFVGIGVAGPKALLDRFRHP